MLRDSIRFCVRHFQRTPGFSVIKIVSLALGMSSFLLITIFVLDEWSFDRHHEKKDRIFRVGYAVSSTALDDHDTLAWVSSLVGPQLIKDYPEVESFCRFRNFGGTAIHNDNSFIERKLFFADAAAFSIFDFEILKGDPLKALEQPNAMVMTKSMAIRYFGSGWNQMDLTSESITFYPGNDTLSFQVAAVIDDVPKNSHFIFEGLVSYKTREIIYPHINGWFSLGTHTYILARENAGHQALESKIKSMVMRYYAEEAAKLGYKIELFLQPLTSIHLHSNLQREIEPNGDIQQVMIFCFLGIFILVLAVINFINLSTAQSMRYTKQTGIRKLSGSTRVQLIRLFFTDAFFYSLFAGLFSLALVEIALPMTENFYGREFPRLLDKPLLFGGIFISLVLLVTLGGGAYPASQLSLVSPAKMLRASVQTKESTAFRHTLIVFQFIIAIILAGGALTVYRQINFMTSQPMGFDSDGTVVIDGWMNPNLRRDGKPLENELKKISGVTSVTFSQSVPGQRLLDRTVRQEGADQWTLMESLISKGSFVEAYNFRIKHGRTFYEDLETDKTSAFVINESAARQFGWSSEEAIGKTLEWGSERPGQVIGVVEDFHYRSLHERITPVVILVAERGHGYVSVKINDTNTAETISAIENVYKKLYPDQVFQFSLLDDQLDSQYAKDRKLGMMAMAFCALAFIIACLGLIGLSSLILADKKKEIGIRKVLGASQGGIIAMMNKRFVTLTCVAVVAGVPLSYYLSSEWLTRFPYHISVDVMQLIGGGALAILLTVLTVSYHSIRASVVNPAEALKDNG
jgi:putative ABC transport system permease protein